MKKRLEIVGDPVFDLLLLNLSVKAHSTNLLHYKRSQNGLSLSFADDNVQRATVSIKELS